MKEVLWLLGVFGEANDAKMMGAQGLRDQGQGLGLSAIREQRQNYKAMESEGVGTAQLIQHELWTGAALGLNASSATYLLSLCSPISKMETIILPTSWGSCED